MKQGNLYYASDKAVSDALLLRKFKNSDLMNIFISRGIIISSKTEREDAALYFSRLNHDYYDHQKIAEIMGVATRKEKSSSLIIRNVDDKFDVSEILSSVKVECDEIGEPANVKVYNKRMEISISYAEVDYGKSEFRQVMQKDCTIVLEKSDDGLIVRSPANRYSDKIVQSIVGKIQSGSDEKLDVMLFDLSGITDHRLRTKFFDMLIKRINGFSLEDVSEVYVYHPDDSSGPMEDSHIKQVSLTGKKVTSSEELDSLFERGFYICRIRWTVIEDNAKRPRKIELEAQFSNSENCTGFSYIVRGSYKFKESDKSSSSPEFVEGRINVDSVTDVIFSRLIEEAAKVSLKKLNDEIDETILIDPLIFNKSGELA